MNNVHKINVKIENKEWEEILDKTFRKVNAKTTVKGFRKGKAPKNVFIKEYGIESLYNEAINEAIPNGYEKALNESKLEPVCQPKVDIKAIDKDHIELEYTIITKPEVKVSSYTKLGVKEEKPKVSKKEIEDEILKLQDKYAEVIEKEDGVVEDGDTAVIDFEGSIDGKVFDGGSGKDYSLEIGSGTFIPGFEEQLIGQKIGETRDIKVTFPEDYTENLKGKDATFKVTVNKIKTRVLPKLDKDFFADLGFDDVKTKEDLEKKVEEHLMEHATKEAEDKYVSDLIDAGLKNMTVEINDEIIEDEIDRIEDNYRHSLMDNYHATLEDYLQIFHTTREKFRETLKEDATKRVKTRYLFDYIIDKEKLDATEEEVLKHAEDTAKTYGVSKDELIEWYGGMDAVKYDLLVHKAIDVLKK